MFDFSLSYNGSVILPRRKENLLAHPGFYGFTQPDSLAMRQEYIRLASAELQLDIPWIIDNMNGTLQKTFGGMPNMEFVIDREGILLASWDWAKPEVLFLNPG